MRKTMIAAALLAFLAVPAWAGGIGVMVSAWSTDQADDDNGLGFKLELGASRNVDLELRVAVLERFESPVGNLRLPNGKQVFELEATPLDFGLAYNFLPDRRVVPYLGGGLSYVLFDSPDGRVEDEAGYYGVAGVEVEVGSGFALFAEALYRGVKAEVEGPGLPFFAKAQVDFAGPAFNLGLLFTW